MGNLAAQVKYRHPEYTLEDLRNHHSEFLQDRSHRAGKGVKEWQETYWR